MTPAYDLPVIPVGATVSYLNKDQKIGLLAKLKAAHLGLM